LQGGLVVPIDCSFSIRAPSQDEFHAIDRVVMRHAFDLQNELGRFYDEEVYQSELTFRCRADGFDVLPEAFICVSHRDFKKRYYLDMLIQQGFIYELKTVDLLVGQNENQLLNYLLLTDLQHGKLINFYPPSVEHRFVSTQLTNRIRQEIQINDPYWEESLPEDRLIRETVRALLADWGAFLDVALYEEAILHFLGDREYRVRSLDVCIDGRVVGTKKLCLLQENTSLHISSLIKNQSSYRKHLARLFDHTCLTRIQWVNFNRNNIELITLKK